MSFFNIFSPNAKIEHPDGRTCPKNQKIKLPVLRQMISLGASCSLQKNLENIYCPNCGNLTNPIRLSSSNTFRLLGSPVLQYRKNSFLICPYCGSKIKTICHK